MSCLPQNLLYHFYYSFFFKTYCYPIGFGHILNTHDTKKYLNLINLLKLAICKYAKDF